MPPVCLARGRGLFRVQACCVVSAALITQTLNSTQLDTLFFFFSNNHHHALEQHLRPTLRTTKNHLDTTKTFFSHTIMVSDIPVSKTMAQYPAAWWCCLIHEDNFLQPPTSCHCDKADMVATLGRLTDRGASVRVQGSLLPLCKFYTAPLLLHPTFRRADQLSQTGQGRRWYALTELTSNSIRATNTAPKAKSPLKSWAPSCAPSARTPASPSCRT